MEVSKGTYTEDQTEIMETMESLLADAKRGTLKPCKLVVQYKDGSTVIYTLGDGKPTMTRALPANDGNSAGN